MDATFLNSRINITQKGSRHHLPASRQRVGITALAAQVTRGKKEKVAPPCNGTTSLNFMKKFSLKIWYYKFFYSMVNLCLINFLTLCVLII